MDKNYIISNHRALTYEDFKFSKYCSYQDLHYLEFEYVVDFPFIITSEFLKGLIKECAEHDWNLDETELYLKQPTKSRNLIKKVFELVRKEYG